MNRRTLLKTIGGATSLSILPGQTAAASEDEKNVAKSSGVATISDGAMSKREREDYFARMATKHDEVVVDETVSPSVRSYRIFPTKPINNSVSIQSRRPSQQPGSIVWDTTDYTVIKDAFGRKVVDCDHYLALYETDVYNESGERYYFFWIWAAASSFDYLDFTGNIWEFHNYIDVMDGGNVLTYDPDGDIKRNGVPVTVDASVQGTSSPDGGGLGASAGISGDFVIGQDIVRPHPRKCSANSNEFCTQWIGDYEGSSALNGTCSLKRDPTETLRWGWNVHLKGGKYMKTI